MKSDVFKKELELIKDERIREDCKYILDLLPEYFYHIPASSTGKYHPEFSLGEGGLVRHVKVATRILYDLLNNPIYTNVYSPFATINKTDKDESYKELGYDKNCFREDLLAKKCDSEKDIMLFAILIHDGLKDGLRDFDYKEEELNNKKLEELKQKRDELLKNNIGSSEIDSIKKEISALYKKVHFTAFDHPLLISNLVKKEKSNLHLTDSELKLLCACLESHMGGLVYKEEDLLNLTKEELETFKKKYTYNISYKRVWNDEKKCYEKSDEVEYYLPLPVSKYEKLVHTADFLSSRRYLNVNFINNDINLEEERDLKTK